MTIYMWTFQRHKQFISGTIKALYQLKKCNIQYWC